MKLSSLHEALGSGAIAMKPAALGGQMTTGPREPRKDTEKRWYLKFSREDNQNLREDASKKKLPSGKSRQPATNVWQWFKGKKQKRWWDQYADTNNPDERLLKQYRGKGL